MISGEKIVKALKSLGLKKGDVLFVHSDLNKFGFVKDPEGRFKLALDPEMLFNSFRCAIGDGGTIVVPAFSYNLPREEAFSVLRTPTFLGVFNEYIRKINTSIRSQHPLFSLAAIGEKAFEIVGNPGRSGFGADSPYKRLHQLNAKLVMIAVPFCSFKDYVESACKVPYRYKKYFLAKVVDEVNIVKKIYEHDVRYLNQGIDMLPLYNCLSERDLRDVTSSQIESTYLYSIDSGVAFDLLSRKLLLDPYVFMTKSPSKAPIMSLIQSILTKSRQMDGEVDINFFSVDENGVEKWIWTISNVHVLKEEVQKDIKQLEIRGADSWWMKLVPGGVRYAIALGTGSLSGADITLSIFEKIEKKYPDVNPEYLKREFIQALLKSEPEVFAFC